MKIEKKLCDVYYEFVVFGLAIATICFHMMSSFLFLACSPAGVFYTLEFNTKIDCILGICQNTVCIQYSHLHVLEALIGHTVKFITHQIIFGISHFNNNKK